jgi:two-component system nitrogen regulation response regulator GlnG
VLKKLLILDDDPAILDVLKSLFERYDLLVFPEKNGKAALERVRTEHVHVALIDMTLHEESGLDVLRDIKNIDPRLCVIMMSGHQTTQNAIEAMMHGAYDYVTKPLDFERLAGIVAKAFESSFLTRDVRIVGGPSPVAADEGEADSMIGSSPEMIEIWKMIGKIAKSDATVLVQGDSGTGKELLARSIYNNSGRRDKPFLAVNCAALPETLLESELFGHERGAFTDAVSRHIGRFEQCAGGTIFLDEIAEMSLKSQAKLLRVLENREFERVGGTGTIKADVRVIAATNRNLIHAVKEKSFRMDLFYRLKVVTIILPPLRERADDIPFLVNFFVNMFTRTNKKAPMQVSEGAYQVLMNYSWPGNIRELKNVIHTAVVFSRGDTLLPEDFNSLQAGETGEARDISHDRAAFFQRLFDDVSAHEGAVFERFIAEAEKALFRMTMEKTGNNEVHASKFLGISRNTLRQRLKAHKVR